MIERFSKIIFVVIMASLGVWMGLMIIDNVHPYEYDAPHSRMIPDPVHQGAMITADWALSRVNRICPGTVQRFFKDLDTGKIASITDTTPLSRGVKIGDDRLPRSFLLPPQLPPRVGYRALVCSECNPLQKISPLCYMTPEIEFHVIP